jgi:hypothetical protein
MFKTSESCSYHCAVKQRLSAFFSSTTHVLQCHCPIARNVRSSAVYGSPNSAVQKTDYGVRIIMSGNARCVKSRVACISAFLGR